MGDHWSSPPPDLRVRWAEGRAHHGVRGAWIGVGVHLVLLVVLLALSEAGDFWPVYPTFAAAGAIGFGWICACWRLDPGETRWAAPGESTAPTPGRFVAAVRAGWTPTLAWLVGAVAAGALLRGLEGVALALLLAGFLVPVALLFAWLGWLLVVLPVAYLGAAHDRRTAPAPRSPYEPVAYDASTSHVTPSTHLPGGVDGGPSVAVPMAGLAVLLLLVLPVAGGVLLSGAAAGRWDVVPALLGYGGVEPTRPEWLWAARVGAAAIVLVGAWTWWWLAREGRRAEHRRRGFGEL